MVVGAHGALILAARRLVKPGHNQDRENATTLFPSEWGLIVVGTPKKQRFVTQTLVQVSKNDSISHRLYAPILTIYTLFRILTE